MLNKEPDLISAEALTATRQYHIFQNSVTSLVIYRVIVFTLLFTVGLLPLVKVDVSVSSSGMLKSSTEPAMLKALYNGVVDEVLALENESVQRNQPLIKIRSPVLDEKEMYLERKISQLNLFIADLQNITSFSLSHNSIDPLKLKTLLYRQSVDDFSQRTSDALARVEKIKQEYARSKKLFDAGVIAASEFENARFELEKAKTALRLLRTTQFTTWQKILSDHRIEADDLESQLNQVQKEQGLLLVTAPVKGSIQGLAGLYPGAQVFVNQDLAWISPDSALVAEIYVSPSDVGLLRPGMSARLQVSAFNYNQWGLLHGTIIRIADDVQVSDGKPFFKTQCNLDRNFLTLTNGYRGNLRKGMVVQARFLVTKRSLWQLLYDKIDDWLNPNTINFN